MIGRTIALRPVTLPRPDSLPFDDRHVTVNFQSSVNLNTSAGPADFKAIDMILVTEPEMNVRVVEGQVAGAPLIHSDLAAVARFQCHFCSDGRSLASFSEQSNAQPVILVVTLVFEQRCRCSQVDM